MDLIFDGRYASEFNLYMCNVTTSAGTEVSSVSELTFDTFRPAGLNKDIFIDATSTNLTKTIQFLKIVDCEPVDIDDYDLMSIVRWFNRSDGYYPLSIIRDYVSDITTYDAKIDVKKIELFNGIIGVEFDITTNSICGYQSRTVNRTLSANESFVINNQSSLVGEQAVDMKVNVLAAGNLEIGVSYNGDILYKIKVKNCIKNENIIFSSNCIYDSDNRSNNSHLTQDFNYKFPKIYSSLTDQKTTFITNLPCKIEVSYKNYRKVGL